MTKFIIIFFLITLVFTGYSQPKQILRCEGNIPPEILSQAKTKYEKDIEKIKNDKNKKVKKDFYLISNFTLDQLMKSGRILFGDDISQYINEVADEVLKSDPTLRKKLKFFVLKSSDVNAFSTQQGFIFINLGLLAQLETEAQLAYIIAHESIHFKYNHAINQYVHKDDLIKGRGKYGRLSDESRELMFYNRSKEDEFEADKLGLTEIFLKSNYSIEDAANVFDILLYSDLPFDEIEFDTTFFDTKNYKLPSDKILKTTSNITTVDNYNDENHTHPNIKKRRENFINTSLDYNNEGKSSFVVSKDRFLNLRTLARKEILSLYILDDNYGKAFYSAYLIYLKNKNDEYANYVMNYVLYAVSKTKTNNGSLGVIKKYKNIEGKSQQIYYIFNSIKKDEFCLNALNTIWKSANTGSYKDYNKRMSSELIADLITNYKVENWDIQSTSKSKVDTTFKRLSKEEYDALSKYEKIKYDKKLKALEPKTATLKGFNILLADLMNDPEFSALYNKLREQYSYKSKSENKDNSEENEEEEAETNEDDAYKSRSKTSKKSSTEIESEPINDIYIVNPQYQTFYFQNIDLIESDEKKRELLDIIDQCSEVNEVKTHSLDASAFKKDDAENYNYLYLVNAYTVEFSNMIENEMFDSDSMTITMMPFHQPFIDQFVSIKNTKHIMYSSVYASIDRRSNIPFTLIYCTIVYPLIPYGIYYAVTPERETEISNVCLDITKGRIINGMSVYVRYNDNQGLLKSQYYDYFHKLKNGVYKIN